MSDIEKTKKDISISQSAQYVAQDNDILGDNLLLSFLSKKAERLASGVYLVTSQAGDDPLKLGLRKASLSLIHTVHFLALSNTEISIQKSLRIISEIVGLISVAASARLISEANAAVLEEEYRKMAGTLLERADELLRTQTRIKSSELTVAFPQAPHTVSLKGPTSRGHINLTRGRSTHHGHSGSLVRRDRVLSLVDEKGRVTVKDVAGVIKGCSEKTIQRELIALVASGVLKREGERRWSTYLRP